MKKATTNRPTNHGRQGSTGGNITYTQAGVSCFVGQESGKFKVQFFVGSSVVKSLPAYSCKTLGVIAGQPHI
jgi:hypothetical protein